MRVKEIHFNHDTSSATSDALNLRRDGQTIITAPEWVDGGASRPAAYARNQLSAPLTIKARFTGGPTRRHKPVRIRAIASGVFQSPILKYLFSTGNALGEVRARRVDFNAAGESALETFELTGTPNRMSTGITETNWIWQSAIGSMKWINFATSRHRIYVIPDLPTDPWTQDLHEARSLQLPWADALEKACLWAFGATDAAAAAAAITFEVNAHYKHAYCRDNQFVPGGTEFRLRDYLDRLSLPDVSMNCRDAASLTVTFANLLGATLSPMVIKPSGRLQNSLVNFQTKNIQLVGQNAWASKPWGWHEVACSAMLDLTGGTVQGAQLAGTPLVGAQTETMRVYDACLELNQAAPYLAVDMPLGKSGPGGTGYRFDLIQTDDVDLATVQAMRSVT